MAFSLAFLLQSVKLPFGTLRAPEAGFWPLILSVFFLLLSVVIFGQALKEGEEREKPFWSKPGSWKKVASSFLALLVFGFAFEYLGALVSIFILITFLMRAIKPQKWWVVIAVALSSSLFSYFIFGFLLKTPLPKGIVGL